MIRRSFLKHLAALPLFTSPAIGTSASKLKIMIKSAWGSDDPTKAAFPFLHGDALSEAGHEVQIFLLGEAVSLCGEEDTDLRMRRLLSSQRRDRGRLERIRR